MKARIKFQKYASMKFVGHLDVMRYFQKALRRADYDSEYTKGFSPHQVMSFAAPLGVGLTSDAEYMDVELISGDIPEVMIERLNAVLTEGFNIYDFHLLLEQEPLRKTVTAMSLVASADYLVSLKDGYTIQDTIKTQAEFEQAFRKFNDKQEIVIGKRTKNSDKVVDIKPMISLVAFDQAEYEEKLIPLLSNRIATKPDSVADVYENGIKLYLQIDTGSSVNLKPELVIEAFCEELGITYEKFAWQMHRLEIYTRDAETRKLAALNQVER